MKTDGYFYVLCDRTNNILERYNRTMNKTFLGLTPNLFLFVEVCEDESRDQYRVQGLLHEGKMVMVHHKTSRINKVSCMYKVYVYNGKATKKTKKYTKGTCVSKRAKKV